MASAQVFFCQYLGGAVFLAVAETIFTNTLRSSLRKYSPDIDPESVISIGATAVRSTFRGAHLEGVLRAYNHAVTSTFVSLMLKSCASLADLGIVFGSWCVFGCLPVQFRYGLSETSEEREQERVKNCDSLILIFEDSSG